MHRIRTDRRRDKMGQRIGSCIRKTKETDISLTIDLDGQGLNKIDTGIPFLIICWTGSRATGSLTWMYR